MTPAPVAAPRRLAWERRTTVPLVVLGAVFIAAYSVYVLAPWIPRGPDALLFWVLIVTWVVFIADIVVRVVLTPHGGRWAFLWTHPVDVLSAIVPVFRAFRVLALLRQVPYLQRRSGNAVRANIVIYAASYAVVFVYFIALATLQAERNAPGASITTFGDAIWWAIVTVATVGYGDTYPITAEGRFYAVFLMAGGIAIVGTASATIISLINERIGGGARRPADPEPETTPDAASEPASDEPSDDAADTLKA